MNNNKIFSRVVLFLTVVMGAALAEDPNGVFFKPIPAKTVVLTFDDSCLSHYTNVAPILKGYGFGGTFYITEFDSFATRKDWYMTWEQIKALDDMGLEVGNHTYGHGSLMAMGLATDRNQVMRLENDLVANGSPKPTTLAYPFFDNYPPLYDFLYAKGYPFVRGGGNRAYRPTVDSPFNVPSTWAGDTNSLATVLTDAIAGQVVVLTFHGVPDMEHPGVSTDPVVFAQMMQYLKDNNYNVIAMRDLGQYVGRINATFSNTPVTGCTSTSAVLHTTFRCAGLTNMVYAHWGTVNGGTDPALWPHSAPVGVWTNTGPQAFEYAGGTNSVYAGMFTNMAPTNLSCTATGLAPNTTYYYTFCVSNDWGKVWAPNVLSFSLGSPTVNNSAGATNLAVGLTQFQGTLSNGVADIYFYWGVADGGTRPANWGHTNLLSGANPGAFATTINVSNLLYGVTYYYRCCASNAFGIAWAPSTASFTIMKPAAPPPVVPNGSFETPALPPASTMDRPSGAMWTFAGTIVGIANQSTWWYPEFAPDGKQAAYMWGMNQYASISQPITFASPGNYTVSFSANARDSALTSEVDVQLDGTTIQVFPHGLFPVNSWGRYTTVAFPVSAGTHTLRFCNTNLTDGLSSIDDVQINGSGVLITLTNSAATGYFGPASSSAVLNAALSCPGSVYQVYAYWNTVHGGTNADQWINSAYLGSWTNAMLTNLSYAVTGLATNTGYFYTFRATNAADDLWATNVMSFGPALGKDILTFAFSGLPATVISGTNITLTVPLFVDVTALAPTYTVSPNALPDAVFPSGAARDFTNPKTYTITAQNGATQTYRVTVTKSSQPIAFNWITSWTNVGAATWVAPAGVTSVRLLVVGGGGASGRGSASGGGGAGGMRYYGDESGAIASAYPVTPGNTYTVTVGNGGAAGGTLIGGTCNGTDSSFGTVTAVGGGGGGNHWNYGAKDGNAGGSGGGGGVGGWSVGAGGAATAGQGNVGGYSDANGQDNAAGGGGGGAGVAGFPGTDQHGGNGGDGLTCSISGSAVAYAGGGGGNSFSYAYNNGSGGTGYLNAGGGGMANGSAAGNAGRDGLVVVNYGGSPTIALNGPTNNQFFSQGVSISATSAVALGMSPYQVSFYMNVSGGTYALAGSVASAPYTFSLGTLAAGTYRIYATVIDGYNNIATSMTNTFTVGTPSSPGVTPPGVDNGGGATNLSAGVTQLRGTLTNGPADVSLYWGGSDGGTLTGNWAHVILLTNTSNGAFSTNVSNLLYGMTYYYRTYASNTNGAAWAMSTSNFTALGSAGNDAPVAFAQSVTMVLHRTKTITLAGSDPDGDSLTYAIVMSPAHGILSGTPPSVTYTPAAGYAGADAFTFKVNDGTTNSAPARITILVSATVLAEDFEHEWADNALAKTTNNWTSGVGDTSSILNPEVGYDPLPSGVIHPLAYDHSAQRRLLKLNTGGDMLLTPDTDAAFASAKVYVDMLANFDVRLDFPEAVSNNANAKTVVFLKTDGASTNLYVLHGQREAGAFKAPAFTAVITDCVEPGTWHRLTVTLDSTTNGTGAEAFRVLFDGKALVSAKAYSDNWKSRVFAEPCGPDGGTWFLSASRRAGATGANVTSLSRLGFEGGGFIDDLAVTYQPPIFSYGTILLLALTDLKF